MYVCDIPCICVYANRGPYASLSSMPIDPVFSIRLCVPLKGIKHIYEVKVNLLLKRIVCFYFTGIIYALVDVFACTSIRLAPAMTTTTMSTWLYPVVAASSSLYAPFEQCIMPSHTANWEYHSLNSLYYSREPWKTSKAISSTYRI